jgi:hypothetical protein
MVLRVCTAEAAHPLPLLQALEAVPLELANMTAPAHNQPLSNNYLRSSWVSACTPLATYLASLDLRRKQALLPADRPTQLTSLRAPDLAHNKPHDRICCALRRRRS